jgi:hypothetical protein
MLVSATTVEDGEFDIGVFDGFDSTPLQTVHVEELPFNLASADANGEPGKEILFPEVVGGGIYGCE